MKSLEHRKKVGKSGKKTEKKLQQVKKESNKVCNPLVHRNGHV